MLKDNWEEKHGTNIPVHGTFSQEFPGTPVGNMRLQPLQGCPHNDRLAGSSSRTNVAAFTSSKSMPDSSIPPSSNLQSIAQLASMEPVSFRHQLDKQFHQQNHDLESKVSSNEALDGSNLQDLIKFLSANYGPMKTPLEVGTPEYLKLVEILQKNSGQPNGLSGQLSARGNSGEDVSSISIDSQENITGNGMKNYSDLNPPTIDEQKPPSQKDTRVSAEKLWEGSLQLSSSVTLSAVTFFKSGEKLVGNNWPELIEVKGKVRLDAFEKYVQDLPRSRNRGLMVISVHWNEESSNIGLVGMKEVAKGYKKSSRVGFANLSSGIDLYICPRSDPIITILAKYGFFKGMAVIDDKPDSMIGCVVWRKSRPVNPVGNTSEGKSSPDSIQLLNSPPGFSISQGSEKKPSPEKLPPESSQHDTRLTLPLTTNSETSKNVAFTEFDHKGANSSSSSSLLQISVSSDPSNMVKKRPFEDDDLPEFDFGISSGKSTHVTRPLNPASSENNKLAFVDCQKLDSSLSPQLPLVASSENNKLAYVNCQKLDISLSNQLPLVNGSLEQSSKKIKLFEDDEDDMPEWCPPEVQHQMPSQSTSTNFQTLPPCPPHLSLPLPPPPPPPPPPRPIPPPSRADTNSSFSYQPFRPAISSLPPTFVGPPPLPPMPPPPPLPPLPFNSLGGFNSNQVSWHRPGSFNVNLPFPPSNGRHSQP
uniref:uncharacterized protein LOC122596067 n=1 Tax=Erigeron canadensis TaxID=72917 RepID=UPI001CB8A47B|nr:uncharacterized protein LOC122596067 [Erigeron canadensis]